MLKQMLTFLDQKGLALVCDNARGHGVYHHHHHRIDDDDDDSIQDDGNDHDHSNPIFNDSDTAERYNKTRKTAIAPPFSRKLSPVYQAHASKKIENSFSRWEIAEAVNRRRFHDSARSKTDAPRLPERLQQEIQARDEDVPSALLSTRHKIVEQAQVGCPRLPQRQRSMDKTTALLLWGSLSDSRSAVRLETCCDYGRPNHPPHASALPRKISNAAEITETEPSCNNHPYDIATPERRQSTSSLRMLEVDNNFA